MAWSARVGEVVAVQVPAEFLAAYRQSGEQSAG
jgi:hypothetical protein